MMRNELIALMPGKGPPDSLDGCSIVRADGNAAIISKVRLIPRVRRADVLRAAVDRARLFETLMSHGTVLPALPGQRIRESDVARLVAANLPALARLSDRLRGTSQYQITVRWDASRAVAHFGRLDLPTGKQPELSMIAATLRAQVTARLAATGAEVLPLPVTGDVVSNSVVLLEERLSAMLDATVAEIDALWSDGLGIRMIGPYPAVSFASLIFDRVDRPAIEAAQGAFGLRPGFSEETLRTARRAVLMQSGADAHELLRRQADLLACVARIGDSRAPVHVARVWSDGMSSASGAVARAA